MQEPENKAIRIYARWWSEKHTQKKKPYKMELSANNTEKVSVFFTSSKMRTFNCRYWNSPLITLCSYASHLPLSVFKQFSGSHLTTTCSLSPGVRFNTHTFNCRSSNLATQSTQLIWISVRARWQSCSAKWQQTTTWANEHLSWSISRRCQLSFDVTPVQNSRKIFQF